jgi:hypothetical protein
MSEVAGPGAEARKVFIRLVDTRVSWGIHLVQNVRVLMGIKPLCRQGPKCVRWRQAIATRAAAGRIRARATGAPMIGRLSRRRVGREVFLFLAGGDPGVADHVGWALLTFGSFGNRSLISFRQRRALRQSRPQRL